MNEDNNAWKRIYSDAAHYGRIRDHLDGGEDMTAEELTDVLRQTVRAFDQMMFELMRQNMLLQRYLADAVSEASFVLAKGYTDHAMRLENELLSFKDRHVHAEQDIRELELEYMDMIVDACSSGLEGFREITLRFGEGHIPDSNDAWRLKKAVDRLLACRKQTQNGYMAADRFSRSCDQMAHVLKEMEKKAGKISQDAEGCSADIMKVMERYSAGALIRTASDEPDSLKGIADALISAGLAMEDLMRANARSFEKISSLVKEMGEMRKTVRKAEGDFADEN